MPARSAVVNAADKAAAFSVGRTDDDVGRQSTVSGTTGTRGPVGFLACMNRILGDRELVPGGIRIVSAKCGAMRRTENRRQATRQARRRRRRTNGTPIMSISASSGLVERAPPISELTAPGQHVRALPHQLAGNWPDRAASIMAPSAGPAPPWQPPCRS